MPLILDYASPRPKQDGWPKAPAWVAPASLTPLFLWPTWRRLIVGLDNWLGLGIGQGWERRTAMDMPKGRLEAFRDGMMAIFITIMVLALKVRHETPTLAGLKPLWLWVGAELTAGRRGSAGVEAGSWLPTFQ